MENVLVHSRAVRTKILHGLFCVLHFALYFNWFVSVVVMKNQEFLYVKEMKKQWHS